MADPELPRSPTPVPPRLFKQKRTTGVQKVSKKQSKHWSIEPTITIQTPKYSTQHMLTRGLPVAETARRLPSDKLRIARPKFDYIIQAGICRPCSSAYISPIHIVPKKRRRLTYLRQLSQTERANRSGSIAVTLYPQYFVCWWRCTILKDCYFRAYNQVPVAI